MSIATVEIKYAPGQEPDEEATVFIWGPGTSTGPNNPEFTDLLSEQGHTAKTTVNDKGVLETRVQPPLADEVIREVGQKCIETLIDNPFAEGIVVRHREQVIAAIDQTSLVDGGVQTRF